MAGPFDRASFDPLSPISDAVTVRTLELLKEGLRLRLGADYAKSLTLEFGPDEFARGAVARIAGSLLTDRVGSGTATATTTVRFSRPANWREAWKAEHASTWYGRAVLRLWPAAAPVVDRVLVECAVDLRQYLTFPKSALGYPDRLGPAFRLLMEDPATWTRTPLTEQFRRPTRDGA